MICKSRLNVLHMYQNFHQNVKRFVPLTAEEPARTITLLLGLLDELLGEVDEEDACSMYSSLETFEVIREGNDNPVILLLFDGCRVRNKNVYNEF